MHNNKTDNFPPIEECFPDENSFCSTHTAADAPKKKEDPAVRISWRQLFESSVLASPEIDRNFESFIFIVSVEAD